MGEKYITRLALAKCSCGSMDNYLNVPKDHGILFQDNDHPIMNANDHEGGEGKNVVHFGRCSSSQNPGNKIGKEDFSFWGLLTGSAITKLIKGVVGCNCKCEPMTFTPWESTKEDHLIQGAEALTEHSHLACFYGGDITILSEEEAEKSQAEYDKQMHNDKK